GRRFVEPLWRTPDKPSPGERWPARAVPPLPQKPAVLVQTHHEGAARTIVVAKAPIDPPGPLHGDIFVSKTDEPIVELVRAEQLASVLITGSAVIILMLLTAYIVNRVVGRPVGTLEAAMKRVEGGVLDERVPAQSRDEVGALSRGFNAMLARLA